MKYKDAGVDIEKGNEAVRRIKKMVTGTFDENVITELGSFGGLYALKGYNEPILVSGTDGVGTKLKLAFMTGIHDTVGIDLVAMSVNDILAQGAKPLFFLDYIATSKVEPALIEEVVRGIVNGCKQSGCALLGGETAELPGFYGKDEYDLAGFAVGVCEKKDMVTGAEVHHGDVMIGLPSSGLHSNGYSLARRALVNENTDRKILEEMLTPTKIYARSVINLMEKVRVTGMVHVTGGGFYENIPRIFNENLKAVINMNWDIPDIFGRIEKTGVERDEMFRTFNMGIGYILTLREKDADLAMDILKEQGEEPCIIGRVEKSEEKGVVFE